MVRVDGMKEKTVAHGTSYSVDSPPVSCVSVEVLANYSPQRTRYNAPLPVLVL